MPATLSELRAGPHLSISQIKTFVQCPRKYFLQYIERVEPSHRSVALAFGSAWHSTIDDFLIRSTPAAPVPNEELYEIFKSDFEREVLRDGPPVLFDDDQEDVGRLIDIGVRMVDAFVDAVPVPQKVIAVELPFAVDITDPSTGEVLPVRLVGAIDALVVDHGEMVLVELKSGKRRWAADVVEHDLQPTAYIIAARDLGHEPDAVKLILTTKSQRSEVQVERLVRGLADEADLFATAASILRAVEAGVDHPLRSWACKGCSFAGACR